jgi:hypothetical protein
MINPLIGSVFFITVAFLSRPLRTKRGNDKASNREARHTISRNAKRFNNSLSQ